MSDFLLLHCVTAAALAAALAAPRVATAQWGAAPGYRLTPRAARRAAHTYRCPVTWSALCLRWEGVLTHLPPATAARAALHASASPSCPPPASSSLPAVLRLPRLPPPPLQARSTSSRLRSRV